MGFGVIGFEVGWGVGVGGVWVVFGVGDGLAVVFGVV